MNTSDIGKTAAIIAEYNPFHNGHAYHISRVRKHTGAKNIVVIMSGNYVQRGDCAISDKFSRTRMAISGGADLVLELSLPFACSSAEKFAYGGASIADSLGCVDYLGFGMECDDIQRLICAADAVDNEKIKSALGRYLSEGKSFAVARTRAVCEIYGDAVAEVLLSPNNTLAVEYIRALRRLNSNIIPIGIQREGVLHDCTETHGDFASATAIRQMILGGDTEKAEKFIPPEAWEILSQCRNEGSAPADLHRCERAILSKLRCMTKEDFLRLPDISEGLENRIYDCVRTASSLDELYDMIKSKRYSHARIRRIILSAFLDIKRESSGYLPYIRILGMNSSGRDILSSAKPKQPIISTYKQVKTFPKRARTVYELECCADDLWGLMTPKVQPCGADMSTKLIVM